MAGDAGHGSTERSDVHALWEFRDRVIPHLGAKAEAVFVRTPIIDDVCPDTSDADVLVFGRVDRLMPERVHLSDRRRPATIDIMWYPSTALREPKRLAAEGLVAHRLLGSTQVFDTTGRAAAARQEIGTLMYRPDIQTRRLAGFLEMGCLTVREVGITWDFPALAVFWLQMAHSACLAAMVDAMRGVCPNVYTRPFDYVSEIEHETRVGLRERLVTALHLDADPLELMAPLERIHRTVSARFSEPPWSPNTRSDTRAEYAYVISRQELEWRIRAASEMVARAADPAAACAYLRFWAYSLSRIPAVWQRVHEGMEVSFLRPDRAVRPDLERVCPDIVDDLTTVLSGKRSITVSQVEESLAQLLRLRARTLEFLRTRGLELPGMKPWQPYHPTRLN